MAQIHLLDSETIDKIAAGEVIERPASIVKELVENAIDAGATAVTVEIKEGGIEFIRVTDNGCGMERDQIKTAFLRHATSKIYSAEDLLSISSLGFRGEALSSIAAVTKVELVTKTRQSLTGTRMVLEGGEEKEFLEVGAPDGTTFIVRQLFFNTPARRKFLKQPATEGGYIKDLMEHLALSRPDVSFKFILGGQMKFHTSGNGDLREVVYRIFGREVANAMVPIQVTRHGITIEGFLGKPIMVRSNRNFEIYYMNGRFIKSNVVAKSVEEGYKEYLMQHKFPFCVLHITMDTQMVDVNVHPTKMDVRFSNQLLVSEVIRASVYDTLHNKEMIPKGELGSTGENKTVKSNDVKSPEPFEVNRFKQYLVQEETDYNGKEQSKKDFLSNPVWARVKGNNNLTANGNKSSLPAPVKNEEPLLLEKGEKPEETEDFEFVFEEPVKTEKAEIEEQTDAQKSFEDYSKTSERKEEQCNETTEKSNSPSLSFQQMELFEEKIMTVENRAKFRIIGQVFDTYWLLQFEDKLLMIDQHAAHEKVKYERLIRHYKEKNVESQMLMPPVIVTLSGREESVLEEYKDIFLSMGFEVESFGQSEYALRSVPTDLFGCSEREMFLEVLENLSESFGKTNVSVVEEKIASMACKAAVKGNQALSVKEAEILMDELLTLENPYNCPHGRPTMITISKYEMEKKFKRIL